MDRWVDMDGRTDRWIHEQMDGRNLSEKTNIGMGSERKMMREIERWMNDRYIYGQMDG